MRGILLLLIASVVPAGCTPAARVENHADWQKEATRSWQGETRARVIAAADAVLKHADPRDTAVEYNHHGFTARRKFLIYALIATASGTETWTFSSAENANGASATVRIIQRGTARAGSHAESFRENQVYLGSLRLFYARIDYLLGRRTDWITCAGAASRLQIPQANPGLQSLCSLTHQGRDTAPPARIPKAPPAGGSGAKSLPPPPELPPEGNG